MRDIILDANLQGIVAFNLSDLEVHFRKVKDKRSKFGKIYPLSMILVILYRTPPLRRGGLKITSKSSP